MNKIILKNKEANFNYEIIKSYLAGIELLGWEVKSIRLNNVNLKNAFCIFKNHELFVINMHISKYMHVDGQETRTRKLLLNSHELEKLEFEKDAKGLVIIPKTLLFSQKGLIKLEIALARNKNKADKREDIKKRDEKRLIKKFY